MKDKGTFMNRGLDRQGMSLLAIMVALAIIGLMCFFAFRGTKKTTDISNKSFIQGAGVDTSSYKGMLESTKKVIKDAAATRGQVPQ